MAQVRRQHDGAKFLKLAILCRASRAGRDMRLDVARMTGIELAIDQRMQHHACLVAIHIRSLPPSAAIQASRSNLRARASRDMTVPIGASMTLEMSR